MTTLHLIVHEDAKKLLLHHIRASGPVSNYSCRAYLLEQCVGVVHQSVKSVNREALNQLLHDKLIVMNDDDTFDLNY